jgi:hypothetical protein
MAEIKITLVNGELAGKTAQDIGKAVREASKELSKAKIGTEEWVKANKKLEDAKQLQEDLGKQIKSTAAASDILKNAFNNLPGAQYFNQISESFGLMKKGVGGLVSQFGFLKTAIAATGIGALVIGLITLVQWFKKTDEGATLLSGIMTGIGKVFDMVFGKALALFKDLGEYFTGKKSIKQGLIDLAEFIGNNLLNRLKAFVVIWDGIRNADIKKVADGFIQMGTGITNATDKMAAFGAEVASAVKDGIELEKQLDAIADRARDLKVEQAETEKIVGQLLLQSKNVALSYEERIALLDRASALELRNHTNQLANAKAMETLRKKELDEKLALGITDDAYAEAYADSQVARINLEKESITLQEKIENRRSALLEKQVAERQKAHEEEVKALHNIQDLKDSLIADAQTREIEQIWTQTQRKIEALTGSSKQIAEQEALLKEQEILAVQAVVDKYAADAAAKKKVADEKELADGQVKANQEKTIAEDRANFEREMDNIQIESGQALIGFGAELLAAKIGDEGKAKAIRKTATLAEIGINLLKERSANAVTAAANPLNAVTFGATGAAQLLTLNTASTIRAALAAARVLVFRKGGILKGPSHEQGGIGMMVRGRMVAEAEGGEPILTSAVSRNPVLLAAASRINVAAGGRPLMAEGGVTPSAASAGQGFDMAGFEQRIASIILAAMDKKITTLRVVNNPLQTQAKIDEIKQIENEVNV